MVFLSAMSAEILRDNLLAIAETYGLAKGLSLDQVSKRFYGNVGCFRRFSHDDAAITTVKYYDMVDEFRKKWPDGVSWPRLRDIKRPQKPGTKRKGR